MRKLLDFLKKRNIKILNIKKNVSVSIEEIKKKNFVITESKRFSIIYILLTIVIVSLFKGGSSKDYIEVEALTCKNKYMRIVYKVTKNDLTSTAIYTSWSGMNKNIAKKGDPKFTQKLKTNDKNSFTYSVFNPLTKKTDQIKYDYKKNQMISNGEKWLDCERKNSFAEEPKKIKTKAKMNDIKDAFKHVSKFKWTSGLACNTNGGFFAEFNTNDGELMTINGKQARGTARKVVNINKISDKKFVINTKFYNNTPAFSAYGNRYPVSTSEKTYTLVSPDTLETRLVLKMADFKNLSIVSYTTKTENSKLEICD